MEAFPSHDQWDRLADIDYELAGRAGEVLVCPATPALRSFFCVFAGMFLIWSLFAAFVTASAAGTAMLTVRRAAKTTNQVLFMTSYLEWS